MSKNQPMNEWIKEVDKDQNVSGLDQMNQTFKNQSGRKWFLSKKLSFQYWIGRYNRNTGKVEIGTIPAYSSQYSDVNAATNVLTCPAGHRYRVYFAGGTNVTAASGIQLSGSINGNSIDLAWNGDSAMLLVPTLGAQISAAAGASSCLNEIWLNAGDSLTQTLTWNIGDDTKYLWLFEDYII